MTATNRFVKSFRRPNIPRKEKPGIGYKNCCSRETAEAPSLGNCFLPVFRLKAGGVIPHKGFSFGKGFLSFVSFIEYFNVFKTGFDLRAGVIENRWSVHFSTTNLKIKDATWTLNKRYMFTLQGSFLGWGLQSVYYICIIVYKYAPNSFLVGGCFPTRKNMLKSNWIISPPNWG